MSIVDRLALVPVMHPRLHGLSNAYYEPQPPRLYELQTAILTAS